VLGLKALQPSARTSLPAGARQARGLHRHPGPTTSAVSPRPWLAPEVPKVHPTQGARCHPHVACPEYAEFAWSRCRGRGSGFPVPTIPRCKRARANFRTPVRRLPQLVTARVCWSRPPAGFRIRLPEPVCRPSCRLPRALEFKGFGPQRARGRARFSRRSPDSPLSWGSRPPGFDAIHFAPDFAGSLPSHPWCR